VPKTKPSEVSNEKIIEVLSELREASQRVIELTRKRLRLTRAEMRKRGLIAKELEKLTAADGSSFVQGLPNMPRHDSPYASAPNHESAYFCGDCGWVKGSPEDDPGGDNFDCVVCRKTVDWRRG
jgi:hypothetical protein